MASNLGQRGSQDVGMGTCPASSVLDSEAQRFREGHSHPQEKSHAGPVPLDPDFSQPFTHTGSSTEEFTASALPEQQQKNPRILSFFHGQATLFL